ncbi:MAG: pyruvate dehydrogenase complex dihydrolipoamide acetyltransferase [Pseudobacter sp.]|uniref:pyruvate dehydrogenase complex dihydrolipoamide acetyltransferase n=1 Tax=Pseudobacter sp. TaxID=2045420 RepID=UPI003F7FB2FC
MAEVILMPRLSDTMTEGVIAAWHKKVGDPVKKGDLLAEVETDKATMELESYKDGTLLHIGTDKGGKLQVNDLLAIIGNPGEDISSLLKGGAAPAPAAEALKAEAPAAAPQQAAAPAATAAPAAAPAAKSGSTMDLSTVPEVILMPRLSDTMTEGVIAEWHKKVGDTVKKGDLLADVETDKATMELESYKEGKLLYIGAQKGDKVAVNSLLCIIGDESKVDVNVIVAAAKGGPAPAASGEAPAQPAAQPASGTGAATTENAVPAASSEDGRVKASPLAKKIASDKGIDLAKVAGSGDNGRIVKKDIDNYVPGSAPAAASTPAKAAATAAPSAPAGEVSFEEVPVSQMRKVIAKRLAESKFSAPHFYVTMNINMDKAVESRAKLNEVSPAKISFNDMVLKACAIALKKHPKVNSSWLGDKIRINHHVNIGVAVAVEEGLLVPVVRFADTKSLSQIATEVKVAAQKAKDKKLQPSDWEGNTFTISNLGMFGVDEFTAIINPPDACILAIGAINQTPVVKNGQIVVGNIMKVTLSCDHRVVDGASGAAFLQTLQGLLEEPLTMLV